MEKKEYLCKCHVCGKIHTVITEFLSSDCIMENGQTFARVSCGNHTSEEIRKAYLLSMQGITKE
jgi:hypothetical protein